MPTTNPSAWPQGAEVTELAAALLTQGRHLLNLRLGLESTADLIRYVIEKGLAD